MVLMTFILTDLGQYSNVNWLQLNCGSMEKNDVCWISRFKAYETEVILITRYVTFFIASTSNSTRYKCSLYFKKT